MDPSSTDRRGGASIEEKEENSDNGIEKQLRDTVEMRLLLGGAPTCCRIMRIICWFFCSFCCPPWPPCMIKKQAFGYQVRSTYDMVRRGPEYRIRLSKDVNTLLQLGFRSAPTALALIHYEIIPNARCFYIPYEKEKNKSKSKSKKTAAKKRLACLYYNRGAGTEQRAWPTVLLSKSRFLDIGMGMAEIVLYAMHRLNVLVYDYCGYGCSDGRLSEKHLRANVETVYEYAIKTLKIPWRQIIAVGSSLGTVATIHLASKHSVGAVILEGAFLSGLRKPCPSMNCTWPCMDGLINSRAIRRVKCPTLFVHGERDSVFSIKHMWRLRKLCPGAADVEPLVMKGNGHVGFVGKPMFWARLTTFLIAETRVMEGTSFQFP